MIKTVSESTIPQEILKQAILLRREVPSRSVSQLIQILEWEGRIKPGEIKRSKLQEKLAERGYSTLHMRMLPNRVSPQVASSSVIGTGCGTQTSSRPVLTHRPGRRHEADVSWFIGCRVDVVFDPADISELTIEYEGHVPWRMRELVIGESAGKQPPLPEHLGLVSADASRLLTAAETARRSRPQPANSMSRLFSRKHWDDSSTSPSGNGLPSLLATVAPAKYKVLYPSDSKLTPRHFYKGLLEQLGCEIEVLSRRC